MDFRLNERHIVALNFLLIAVLAYFAALSVNDIVAMRLTTPRPALTNISSRRTNSGVGNLTRGAYQEIVSRDIFNITPPPQPRVQVVEKINLPYELVGVSTLSAGKAPYAILSDRTGQQTLYKLGQNIPDAGKMVEVDKDRIIIDHSGKRVALELPKEALPGPVMGAQPVPPPVEDDGTEASNDDDDAFDPNVEDLGDNRYKIPKSTIDHSLGNMNQLLTQIRAMPNIQNGRTNGFSLSEIEPGSVFDEMGLQEGDVLQSVNGQNVTDPSQAMQMMSALRNVGSINIVVMRDGHPTTLTYQIQ